jgi:hypothetical protein
MSRLTNSGVPAAGYASSYTSQQFPVVALPASPSYPSASTRGMPPRRVLETIARRRRPRWGLYFMFMLVLFGGLAYAGRKVIPALDARITLIEVAVREVGRQYGFIDGSPAPLARPAGNLPETSESAAGETTAGTAPGTVALARAGAGRAAAGNNGRPDIQPLGIRPSATLPPSAAITRPAAVAPGLARGSRGHGRHRIGAVALTTTPRARFRRRLAAGRASTAAANAATAALNAPAAAAPAAAPVVKPAAAEKPAVAEKPAPSEAVKAAANSGDELDQLMASAVGPAPKAGSDLDKKLSTVQKGEAGVKVAKPDNGAQPLGRSEIQTVMRDVQSQMGECMRKTGAGGPVDVKITVAPDGDVKSTVIKGAMAGTPTGACVESKLKATVFPPSSGQSFDYRLVVR